MPKLLYTAEDGEGRRVEGFVDAATAQSAREQLEAQGLREVTLQQSPSLPQDEAELQGLSPEQQRELARLKLRLMEKPTVGTVLGEVARRQRWWLAVDAAMVVWGLARPSLLLVAAGLAFAVLPFAIAIWNYRHSERYQRLIRAFAVGHWDTVKVLARELRGVAAGRADLAMDLDMRLGAIYARERSLDEALQRLETWRARLASKPGLFESRIASVHHMVGDTAGFVDAMQRAHEPDPQDPSRLADHALAQARFGDVDRAEALLAELDPKLLPTHGQGFVHWARGLVQLRRGQPEAAATLGQAVASLLQMAQHPAVWTALALASADHAIAMHETGHHEVAKKRIAEVWPILEVHATVPLLRMLESDGLLPDRVPPHS